MATIQTSIMINDMMSQQFRAMNMAMSTVIDSFHSLHDATSNAVDVSALEAAQRELRQVEASYNSIEQEINQANQSQERFNDSINEGSNLAKRFGGAIAGAVAAYASFSGLEKLVGMSDEYAHTSARVAMMNDGLQTTGELQDKIYKAAQNAYSPFEDTVEMVAKLGNNAANAFSSSAEVVDFAELIQKQFTIAGTSAIEASNASLQLTQALGSGVLRGDELNSIFEQAPNLIQNIADYLEVPIGAIREMASEGEITAEIVKQSMFAAADDINHKFNSMPKSWNGAWTIMTNEAQKKMESVFHRINDFINSANFAYLQQSAMQAFDAIVMGINFVIAMLVAMADVGSNALKFFQEYRAIFEPIALVLGIIAGSIAAIFIWLGLVKTATLAWAAAQWVVDVAYLGSPITWVLIGIIAIIALIVYALINWGEQTATVLGYIYAGFVGLGVGIYNILLWIGNIAIMVAEWFVNTWKQGLFLIHLAWIALNIGIRKVLDAIGNGVITAAEWVANTWNTAVYGVQMAFYIMAQIILKLVGGVADGTYNVINKVLGAIEGLINGAIGGVNKFIGLLNGVLDTDLSMLGTVDLQMGDGPSNFTERLQGLIHEPTRPDKVEFERMNTAGDYMSNVEMPTAPEAVSFNRFEYVDIGEAMTNAFDYAYDGTMVVSESLNDLVDKAKDYLNYETPSDDSAMQAILDGYGLGGAEYGGALDDGMSDLADAINKGNGAGRDTAGNTKRLADSVDMASEDLKYLRDIADRDVINRFTTAEITVDARSENHIHHDTDIDGIIDRFGEKIEEVAETLAEGDDHDV